jgi:hypothetical protein
MKGRKHVLKGCRRCSGDLWAEEDVLLRVEDLVCLQCGHRQTTPDAVVGRNAAELVGETRRRMAPRRLLRVRAQITSR